MYSRFHIHAGQQRSWRHTAGTVWIWYTSDGDTIPEGRGKRKVPGVQKTVYTAKGCLIRREYAADACIL